MMINGMRGSLALCMCPLRGSGARYRECTEKMPSHSIFDLRFAFVAATTALLAESRAVDRTIALAGKAGTRAHG